MKRVIPYLTILMALSIEISVAGSQFPKPPGQSGLKDETLKEAQIVLAKQSVAGDGKTAGIVQLGVPATSELTLNLTSGNTQVATVEQSSVTIRSGQTKSDRFSINTSRVTQNATVTITASLGKAKISKSLAVTVRIDSIKFFDSIGNNIEWVCGGGAATGLLALSGSPPAGAQAVLTSGNTQVLKFGNSPFPSATGTMTVNLGPSAGAPIVVTTSVVQQNTQVTITATYNGVSATKNFGVAKPQLCNATPTSRN